jgi:hypothetical protein
MKPIVFFQGAEKGLVLNKTNANTIAGMYSPETSNWIGKQVTLFPTQVDFQGRQVAAIRVRLVHAGGMPATPAAPFGDDPAWMGQPQTATPPEQPMPEPPPIEEEPPF